MEKKSKSDRFWPLFWPWPRTDPPPPAPPLGGFGAPSECVLGHLANVILGGSPCKLTWLVDLTSCHLSSVALFIDPWVRKIRNEASSCPGIFSRTLHFYYVASSPGSPLPHMIWWGAGGEGDKSTWQAQLVKLTCQVPLVLKRKSSSAAERAYIISFSSLYFARRNWACVFRKLINLGHWHFVFSPKYFGTQIISEISDRLKFEYTEYTFSFFLGFRRPNLITGLSGWRTPDLPLRTQEPVPDRKTGALPNLW